MRTKLLIFLLIIWILWPISGSSSQQERYKDGARLALKTQDYSTAVEICLEQLAIDPEDYEFNFFLTQAYAFSGRWEEALATLNKLSDLYPDNTDVLLFKARVTSWKKEYREAESGYREVLGLDPQNTEAKIGLAEVASWEGRTTEAIALYEGILGREPGDPDIYFRIGRIYFWAGNYDKSREYYKKAISLDPQNKEYRKALGKTSALFKEKYELRYEYLNESYSDDREPYISHHLVFHLNIIPDVGPLLLKANWTERFQERDSQFGLEFYPRLWRRAYAYFDFTSSPKAIYYPETAFTMEVYQSFFTSAEASLGYRRMNFTSGPFSIYLGSLGYYFGNYYAYLRLYYTPEESGEKLSWIVQVRRYFSKDNYLSLGYGQGSRPFDIVNSEDMSVERSRLFQAGFDWYLLGRIKLQFLFVFRDEMDLKRTILFFSTGYKW